MRPAGPQTVTLEIDRPPAPVRAGQFAFLSARLAGRWQPWHPFSISSVTTDRIAMTVKGVGDFTSALAGLRAGDRVKLDLPYGGFTTDGLVPQAPVVMVAGGVGMAPLHDILEELAARPRPPAVTLVYSVHHESELLFRAEIEEWVRRVEGWRSVLVVTAQPEWRGERGRVTAERLAAWCGDDLHRATFFLCGPVGMLWAVRRGLRHRGIPRQRIRSEQFVFLP